MDQHITVSKSTCIRRARSMGVKNSDVKTSGYVAIDDFAYLKGHKYMCGIMDLYTRNPLAVFGSRYGEEIVEWFRKHPEIRLVSRDGSQMYSRLITLGAPQARQCTAPFHLISRGCLTPEVMDKRMNGKLGSYLAHRATRTIRQKYTEIRANVRENNNKFKKQKVRVSKKAIWSYILTIPLNWHRTEFILCYTYNPFG